MRAARPVRLERVGEAGDVERGAAEHDQRDLAPGVLGAVEVEGVAHLAGDLADAVLEHDAQLLVKRVGCGEVGRGDQSASVGDGDAAALGQLAGHRLEAPADDAGEAADRALGDRHVGEPVDVQVQDAAVVLGVVAVERADQRERGQVDALRAQAGLADGGEQAGDHVALGGDEHDLLARSGGRVVDAERLEVEDGVRRAASAPGPGPGSGRRRRAPCGR